MNFKLEFEIPNPNFQISPQNSIVFLGSCFAENIGGHLLNNKFNCLVNPNGIVFNPISICDALISYLKNEKIDEEKLFYHNNLWSSWQHHGSFSSIQKEEIVEEINRNCNQAHLQLKNAEFLIVSFGSAFVFEHIKNNEIVANCHKIPSSEFKKRILTLEEITNKFEQLLLSLKAFNPNLKLILTVSPVRYIRDGLIGNNLSKSVLLQATYELCNQNKNAYYFPAYEIVIDELRDYRFFESDFIHPNELAIKYVLKRFIETCFDDEAKHFYREMELLMLNLNHKTLHKGTNEHKSFIESTLKQIAAIGNKYSFVELKLEAQKLQQQLSDFK